MNIIVDFFVGFSTPLKDSNEWIIVVGERDNKLGETMSYFPHLCMSPAVIYELICACVLVYVHLICVDFNLCIRVTAHLCSIVLCVFFPLMFYISM